MEQQFQCFKRFFVCGESSFNVFFLIFASNVQNNCTENDYFECDFYILDASRLIPSSASKKSLMVNIICLVKFSMFLLFSQVVVMSATMDVDHFSKYFNNAPVLYIEGRQHQVEVRSFFEYFLCTAVTCCISHTLL